MRFKSNKNDPRLKLGIVTRKWFAWSPVTIDGETRWLEFVTVEGYWFKGLTTGSILFMEIKFINP